MLIKTAPYIIFDFETGGFSANKNPMTELAALSIYGDTLETITQFEGMATYYDDTLEYDQQALNATHISHEMIAKGEPLKDIVNRFCKFCTDSTVHSGAKHKPILVGHNPKFDIPFLQQIFFKCKKDMSKFLAGREDFYGNFQPDYIDTIREAQMLWGNDETMTAHKLIDCINKAGLELVDAHRAMNDVVATKDLLVYFINHTRNTGGEGAKVIQMEQKTFRKAFKF